MNAEKDWTERSDAVQEIIGRPPTWMVQWGTLIAFATATLLGWIGFFLEYPEFVTGDILVQSTNPAQSWTAEEDRSIQELFFAAEDTADAGAVIVVFANDARFQDVLNLESAMSMLGELTDSSLLAFNPGRDFRLGEVQVHLLEFLYRQDALRRGLNQQTSEDDLAFMRRNATNEQQEIRKLRIRIDVLNKQIDKVTDTAQKELFLQDRQLLLQTLQEKQFSLDKLERELSGIGKQRQQTAISESSALLKESFIRLQNKLADWKQEYLVTAPFQSVVRYNTQKIQKGQTIRKGQEILQLVPLQPEALSGRMLLSLGDASKVHDGQEVVVNLDNYPSSKFGALPGKIVWKGSIPVEEMIPVEIFFPTGKTSTTGVNLNIGLEMTGKARIVVARKKMIQRVFETFR
jgi:hypothetical protein